MPDRRQRTCTTPQEIAIAKIEGVGVRDGEDREAVLREMLARLQERFGVKAKQFLTPDAAEDSSEKSAGTIPEQEGQLDERLKTLVVDAIDARYPDGVEVKGEKRTGAEIARAIPDVEAFLAEVNLQKENSILLDFFEVNADGQLVMKDDCSEAYGLGENALEARIRQTRVVYQDADGQTKVMTGQEYFTVTKRRDDGMPLEMKVSENALSIDKGSILMQRGLPTLQRTGAGRTGEYARMNDGKLEVQTYTWTDDENLSKPKDEDDPRQPDFSRARYAGLNRYGGRVSSVVYDSSCRNDDRGSRGVLRVNLNFES